jgi:hypothetical protein
MSWTVADLREQATRVRAYWRDRANVTLSAEGATLLSMVEAMPADAVVLPRSRFDALVRATGGSI